jgi:dipeptidyl-peptidase-4
MVDGPPTTLLDQLIETDGFRAGRVLAAVVAAAAPRALVARRQPSGGGVGLWLVEADDGAGDEAWTEVDLRPEAASGGATERDAWVAQQRSRAPGGAPTSLSASADGLRFAVCAGGRLHLLQYDGHDGHDGWIDVPGPEAVRARISPDGRWATCAGGARWSVVDLDADGAPEAILPAPPEGYERGHLDHVRAEELGASSAEWWSDDSTHVAVVCVDRRALGPPPTLLVGAPPGTAEGYPIAGGPNVEHVVEVLRVLEGTVHLVDRIPRPAGSEYLVDVGWTVHGDLRLVTQPRDQGCADVHRWPAGGGELVHEARFSAEPWLPAGAGRFHLGGERPWYAGPDARAQDHHLQDGEDVVALPGVVPTRIEAARADGRPLVVSGPLLDRAGSGVWLLGDGAPERLDDDDGSATTWSSGAASLVEQVPLDPARPVRCRFVPHDRPAAAVDVSSPVPTPARTFEVHRHDLEHGIQVAVLLPDGDDPAPVVLSSYGGPGARRVLDTWPTYAGAGPWLEAGFAVVVVDGRGAPTGRWQDERALHGRIDEIVLADQLRGLDAALAAHARLDGDRVGVRGWSFGGYLALLAARRHPDRFRAAVSGAPVTDWRWYDTHYTERYLGHPEEHADWYDATAVTGDQPIEVPTLLVLGLRDDNVLPIHGLALLRDQAAAVGSRLEAHLFTTSGHHLPEASDRRRLLQLELAFLRDHLQVGIAGRHSGSIE